MRLPFGLGRRSSSGDGAPSDDPSAGFDAEGVDTGIAAGAPASPRAWASLPPIQRSTGAMPLVADPDAFVEGLPGSQGLPPIVQPLGHEVSNLATPGLVVARTRAVESASSGSIPAPLQRRATRSSRSASVQTSVAPEASASPVAESTQAAALEAPDELPLPVVQPIRSMPTVSRQSVRVPDRPLTSAASAARPAAVQRAAAAAEAAAAGLAPLPAPISGGMRRVPSGSTPSMPVVSRQAAAPSASPSSAAAPAVAPVAVAPSAASVASSTQRAAAAPSSAAPVAPSLPVAQRSASSAPTRSGLGEPMTSLPASARPIGAPVGPVVSRTTTSGPIPVAATSLLQPAQRSASSPAADASAGGSTPAFPVMAGAPTSGRAPGSALGASGSTAQRMPALPHLPVVGMSGSHQHGSSAATTSAAASSASGSASSSSRSTSASVQTSAAPEIRPIAASNPIRPSFVLQRSEAGEDDDDAGDDAALPSPWWAPATESRAGGGSSSAGGFDGGPAQVQRSTARDSGGAGSGSARPTAHTSGAGVSAARANAAAAAVQRSASPATRPLPPARGAVPESRSGSATPVSSVAAPVAPSHPAVGVVSSPVVQTSPGPRPPAPAGSSAPAVNPPSVQREGGSEKPSAGASSHGSRAHSERELEELSQMLFSRIRSRLRSDLIHDREAKGLTFDNV